MKCCSKRSQSKPFTHHCCILQEFVAGFKRHLLQRGGVGLNSNAIQWFVKSFKTHVICHKWKVSRVYHNSLKHKEDQSSEHSRAESVGLFKQFRSKIKPLNPSSLENISINILLAVCLSGLTAPLKYPREADLTLIQTSISPNWNERNGKLQCQECCKAAEFL